MRNNNINVFLALVKAGLWEKPVVQEFNVQEFKDVDWTILYQLAKEQSVQGLVLQGIEELRNHNDNHNINIPQGLLLRWIGEVQMIEQQNKVMNAFIADLIEKLRKHDIYALLVKGQGIAQCYEKPLWRTSGDVDLLLSKDNYEKARVFLLPLASNHKSDERYSKHLGMNIDQWYVEIHGTLRTGLSEGVDREVDKVQRDVFSCRKVRAWENHGVQVLLPALNEDVFFVFTHFIKHFYKEGMNLRQVCDWCRLLWTFRDKIDVTLIEERLKRSGLMNEWLGFASLAVNYLGMPVDIMPLYSSNKKCSRNAEKIIRFILNGYSGNKVKDTMNIAKIFPFKTMCYFPSVFLNVNVLKIKERILG